MKSADKEVEMDLGRFNISDGELRIVSICSDVVLYTPHDISSIAEAVLYIYDRFLGACPADCLKWYSTENLHRHRAMTPRAMDMLRGWLKPGAPRRRIINIHLKDGDNYADAPTNSFWIWGNEEGEPGYGIDSNCIRCAFAAPWETGGASGFLAFVVDLCNQFPFQSGHAGYALETTRYRQEASDLAAWRLSSQHPGLDISRPITDAVALQNQAIKGVNWLTILCNEFVERVGGAGRLRDQLPDSVVMIPVKGGLVLQAGPEPRVGHVNRNDRLPDYRAVYKVVAPLQEPIIERFGALDLPGGDHREKTQAWLRRFAND